MKRPSRCSRGPSLPLQTPRRDEKAAQSIDEIVQDPNGIPTVEEIRKLRDVRMCLVEGMRLYPAPPILIRRAIETVDLPKGGMGKSIQLSERHGLFHRRLESSPLSRPLGKSRPLRPFAMGPQIHQPKNRRLERLRPRISHRVIPERSRHGLRVCPIRWRAAPVRRRRLRHDGSDGRVERLAEEIFLRARVRRERRADDHRRDHSHQERFARQS